MLAAVVKGFVTRSFPQKTWLPAELASVEARFIGSGILPAARRRFDGSHKATGQWLPLGAKPFVNDGNTFWSLACVLAMTHGPRAGGDHTLDERVSIGDLMRVTLVDALTAVEYCG